MLVRNLSHNISFSGKGFGINNNLAAGGGGPTQIFLDNFAGAPSTGINGRIPDVGSAWVDTNAKADIFSDGIGRRGLAQYSELGAIDPAVKPITYLGKLRASTSSGGASGITFRIAVGDTSTYTPAQFLRAELYNYNSDARLRLQASIAGNATMVTLVSPISTGKAMTATDYYLVKVVDDGVSIKVYCDVTADTAETLIFEYIIPGGFVHTGTKVGFSGPFEFSTYIDSLEVLEG